jgi:hypothetical protein
MTNPKHERLIEKLMDAYWSAENGKRSTTDPDRMLVVIACITTLLRSQPRSVDDMGALEWAADWLDIRLEEDADG